ncbi:hypothetical protein VTN96DRAFT_9675 [Rasamsonia emersonii]
MAGKRGAAGRELRPVALRRQRWAAVQNAGLLSMMRAFGIRIASHWKAIDGGPATNQRGGRREGKLGRGPVINYGELVALVILGMGQQALSKAPSEPVSRRRFARPRQCAPKPWDRSQHWPARAGKSADDAELWQDADWKTQRALPAAAGTARAALASSTSGGSANATQ